MKSSNPLLVACVALVLPTLAGCAADARDAAGEPTAEEGAAASKTDLRKDLAKPGGPRGTPFAGRPEQPVSTTLSRQMKALADRCIEYREAPHVLLDTRNKCPNEITGITRSDAKEYERATLKIGAQVYTAVFWDSENSDGGDMQDVALYDAQERRLGVYRELFSRNSTVLDAFAAAFSNDTPVVKLTATEYADGVLRGASDDLARGCHRTGGGECTFAVDLYAPTEAQWQTFVASEHPALLPDAAAIKAAMKECLFTTFAYTHYTAAQQEALASRLLDDVSARSSSVDFYRGRHAWAYPALASVRTTLVDSAAVGGPDCALIVKERGAPLFVSMSSDVND